METKKIVCPDCDAPDDVNLARRDFLKTIGTTAAAVSTAGLPLWELLIPSPCSNEHYELVMRDAVARAEAEAVECFAFGDLFLEDIRAYRERQLSDTKLKPIFPLWGRDTRELASEMITGGLAARITCVDPRLLPASFAGREFDAALLSDLPPGIDPCGERGEFHTFAYRGPMFASPLSISGGVVVERDGFVFADLLPA